MNWKMILLNAVAGFVAAIYTDWQAYKAAVKENDYEFVPFDWNKCITRAILGLLSGGASGSGLAAILGGGQ
jgi:hypothetical protein